MLQDVNMKIKVCLLGDGAVGKSCLIRRFVEDMFSEDYFLTLGTKTSLKKITIQKPEMEKNFNLTFVIWDIMGQISFQNLLHPDYLKGAKGAIVMCDLTRRETLEHLEDWTDNLYNEGQMMPTIFVANKSDLSDQYRFLEEDIRDVASSYNSLYFKTSAKTGENVEKAFNALGEEIIKNLYNPSNPMGGMDPSKQSKSTITPEFLMPMNFKS
jgi:small GTP-binding protein